MKEFDKGQVIMDVYRRSCYELLGDLLLEDCLGGECEQVEEGTMACPYHARIFNWQKQYSKSKNFKSESALKLAKKLDKHFEVTDGNSS